MAHQGSKPAWLYETLPYLYIGAGALAVYGVGHAVAYLSGAILIGAGVLVWSLRYRARQRRRQGRDHPRPAAQGNAPAMEALPDRATYTRLVWRREYECGYPTLDAQHRLLFEAGNDLLSAILEQRDKLDVELLLDDLIGHVEHHFHEEEAIMAQASHPVSPEHRTRHEELLARVKALGENYHGGSLTVADLFTFIADDLVVQHILKDDLRFLADTDRPASVGA